MNIPTKPQRVAILNALINETNAAANAVDARTLVKKVGRYRWLAYLVYMSAESIAINYDRHAEDIQPDGSSIHTPHIARTKANLVSLLNKELTKLEASRE